MSLLIGDKRMSARRTRSKAKQRTEMPDTEAKLDAVLAKMDELLAAKDEPTICHGDLGESVQQPRW